MGCPCGCFRARGRKYEVIWDYKAQKTNEISVNAGDEVILLRKIWKKQHMCYWAEVEMIVEGCKIRGWMNGAFIVDKKNIGTKTYLKDGRWYRGEVKSISEAKEILMDESFRTEGTFLICRPKEVREGEGKWPEYVIAVKEKRNPPIVAINRIKRTRDGQYYILHADTFLSLLHLVWWYSRKRLHSYPMLRPDLVPEKSAQQSTVTRRNGKPDDNIPAPPLNPMKCPRKRPPVKSKTTTGKTHSTTRTRSAEIPTQKFNHDVPDNFLIDRSHVNVNRQHPLGSGHFAQVFVGTIPYNKTEKKVAVKLVRPKDKTTEDDIFREARIMTMLYGKTNTLKIIGCNFDQFPFYIVTEFMNKGTLKAVLQNKEEKLSEENFVDILNQVCMGMRSMEKLRLVHRDLAARNIFMSHGEGKTLKVKVGDFGLARKVDKDTGFFLDDETTDTLPWRWMPLEAIKERKFSTKSDVWSFGVLMFEVFSRGKEPYYDIDLTDADALTKYLEKNGKMKRDKRMPTHWSCLQEKCFERHPEDRPSFAELGQVFGRFVTLDTLLEKTDTSFTEQTVPDLVLEIVAVARKKNQPADKETAKKPKGKKKKQRRKKVAKKTAAVLLK